MSKFRDALKSPFEMHSDIKVQICLVFDSVICEYISGHRKEEKKNCYGKTDGRCQAAGA